MTRIPLRPLARILNARASGENPDLIERENIARRHEAMRDKQRHQAEGRLVVMAVVFTVAFSVVGMQNFKLAATEPTEPRAAVSTSPIAAQRADITDRNGRVLATNLLTYSLYAQPHLMTDKERSASELAAIFPDLKEEDLLRRFNSSIKFMWIKKKLSPEQKQAVHDIGDPGLLFGPREMRLYPNGRLAARDNVPGQHWRGGEGGRVQGHRPGPRRRHRTRTKQPLHHARHGQGGEAGLCDRERALRRRHDRTRQPRSAPPAGGGAQPVRGPARSGRRGGRGDSRSHPARAKGD